MNIALKKGNDRNLKVTVTDATGAAIDVTGWSVRFMVKKTATVPDAQAIISKLVTSVPNPTLGIINIPIDGVDTEGEQIGHYVFDIRVKDAANKEHSSDTGAFQILQPVADEV